MNTKEQGQPGKFNEVHAKRFDKFCNAHYHKLLAYVRKSVFKGSENFYGHCPEDVLNQAFTSAAAFIADRPDKIDELLQSEKGFDNYIYKVILKKSRDIFCDLCRFDVKKRIATGQAAKELLSESYSEHGFELVEKRNLLDGMNRSMRALLRMMEEGKTVREIMKALDMVSVRQYYKARATLLEDLERLGQ